MINVLVKHQRNKGVFDGKGGEKIEYDNVVLTVARLDPFGLGLSVSVDKNEREAKIPYEKFKEIVGYSYEDFQDMFSEHFFGHEVSLMGTLNYGRFVVTAVEITEVSYITYTDAAMELFEENKSKLVDNPKNRKELV